MEYNLALECVVWDAPRFNSDGNVFEIPVNVSEVKISERYVPVGFFTKEFINRLKGEHTTLYYENQVLPVFKGDKLIARGNIEDMMKPEVRPKVIELLDQGGNLKATY